MKDHVGKCVEMLVYYITQKPVRTVKGELMYFVTFIDAYGDWVDSVHFQDMADKYRLTGKGFYHVNRRFVDDFGVYSIEVSWMKKIWLRQPGQNNHFVLILHYDVGRILRT